MKERGPNCYSLQLNTLFRKTEEISYSDNLRVKMYEDSLMLFVYFIAKSPVKKTESWGYLGEATEQWEREQQQREHQQSESVAAVQTTPQVNQDIVPQQLIDHFVSMTHPSQAHKTDNEIAHHCAYSLPAVALTLGRENWALLKEAYNALASDMQVSHFSSCLNILYFAVSFLPIYKYVT